jgi:hypothetical protein
MGNPYIAAAKRHGAPYELGISRIAVLRRDGWRCRMEKCQYGNRSIDPSIPGHIDGKIPDHRGSR